MQITHPLTYHKSLTGLRFMAALMVFFSHFPIASLPPFLQQCMMQLQVGVPIFFVLSGYLICSRYFYASSFNASWFKTYFINRFARIYPLFFILTIGNVLFKNEGFRVLMLNLTFLKGFSLEYVYTGIGQGWSITTEECFYLLAPLIFFLLKKGVPVLLQVVLLMSIGFLLVALFKPMQFHGFFASNTFMMVYTFFGRCFEFFAGIYLALFLNKRNYSPTSRNLFTYSGVAGISLIIILLALSTHLKQGADYFWLLLHNFISPLIVVLLITGLLYETTFISRFLSTPAMQLLGKSSYAFYLIHVGVLQKLFTTYVAENLLYLLLYCIVLSIVIYLFIEKPLNAFIRKKSAASV